MYILVVNLGLKSIRGIIFDETGQQVYAVSKPVSTRLYQNRAEQDPSEWSRLLKECLQIVKSDFVFCSEIQFITVTTSSSCALGCDKNMEPVTPCYMVSDRRADHEAKVVSGISKSTETNSDYVLKCSASSPIAKWEWLRCHEPKLAKVVFYWMNAGDFLVHYLTDTFVTDPLNAEKFLHSGEKYLSELLNKFDLSSEKLPKVIPVGSRIPIKSEVTKEFGFHDHAELVITTYDAICAVIGSFDGSSDSACDVSGTVTSVRVLGSNFNSVKAPLISQYIPSIDKNVVGCSNNLGGGIIEWYRQFRSGDNTDEFYARLCSEAETSTIGARGVVFLPYLMGERAPVDCPKAKGTFFGLRRETTPMDFSRAVFEASAFVVKDLVNALIQQGIMPKSLTVSGGLARLKTINQIKADVLNLPVHVLDNFESTSIGSFILAGINVGYFKGINEAAQSCIRIRQIIHPRRESSLLYEGYFALFKQLHESLQGCYDLHWDLAAKSIGYSKATLSNL